MTTYKLVYCYGDWEAHFEVDLEAANAPCKASLDFFGDPITRDDDTPECNVEAFLQFWGPTLVDYSMRTNIEGVIMRMAATEGTIPLDGSKGIKLIYCNNWSFDTEDFSVNRKY